MNEAGITIQEFLQIYQTINGQFDTFLTMIAVFATVFGVIVAIVVGFFAIRQINVDREIRQYRDEIKKQKETAIEEVKNLKTELTKTSSWAKETKTKIEQELKKPPTKQTKKELEKLEEKIEHLREEIAFKQGALSASPGVITGSGGIFGQVNLNEPLRVGVLTPWQEQCKKCKQLYDKSYESYGVLNNLSLAGESNENKCPHCGNIN